MQGPWTALQDAADAAAANPEVTVVVTALTLAAVAGAVALLRYRRPPGVRLRRLLADLDEVVVPVLPHPAPEPMATALPPARAAPPGFGRIRTTTTHRSASSRRRATPSATL